ncbi:MAG TPA: DUF1573 domain-containing protein [Ferruginibacter sp.]|nr:DUF1573 domain-containing protein [Ferruginibacter sp.]
MKKIFTVLLATCMVAALNAQQLTTAPAVAKSTTEVKTEVAAVVVVPESLLTLKEAEFDFGKIPQGKPVTHIFEVTNKSNEILKIANVQASCGCTTPEWEKEKSIAPGESTRITVGYNAAAEGVFTKFITVTYNGAQTKQITIKGEVWKTPGSSAPENKGLNDLKN